MKILLWNIRNFSTNFCFFFFKASTVSSQLLLCVTFVTTWDVVIIVIAKSFWIGIAVGVLVGLSLPAMLSCMAEMRQKSAVNNLRSKKLLTQNNGGSWLSFLTVTQCLQLPCSKVSKMMMI